MIATLPDGRRAVMIGGRCYGKYRTLEAARNREVQVYDSHQPAKTRRTKRSAPPWWKSKKLRSERCTTSVT